MRVNVSAIKCFQRSEAEWYYRYHLRRVPRRPEGAYFSVGTWWHEVMERFITDRDNAIEFALDRMKTIHIELSQGENTAAIAPKFLDEANRLWALLPSLPERFFITSTLAIEQSIETSLYDEHTLIGRPDRVVEHAGRTWHMQYRTLSDRTPMDVYIRTRERDLHELVYAYLICGKYRISPENYGGTIMNIVRKLSHKAIKERPDSAFVQELIPIDFGQVTDAITDIKRCVYRMNAVIDNKIHPTHTREADTNRFGNVLSPYYDVYTERVSIDDDTLFMTLDDPYSTETVEAPE